MIDQKSKIFTTLTLAIILGLFLGIIGLVVFSGIGGNDCDVPGRICNCFCCNMFGMRGYEACGLFGALTGFVLGIILALVYKRIR